MIRLQNIQKVYNRGKRNQRDVLKDIDLELPRQGLVIVLGDSGSGKTTLLNIAGGLDRADGGTITFDETTYTRYRHRDFDDLRNTRIGYVFQHYYLLPEETVYQNIRLTLKMVGLETEQAINARVDHMLELVGLRHFKYRRANQLSGGQQQRAAIARALSKDPDVLIADEPTGNLDSKNTFEIMRILKAVAKEKLVLLVTHEAHLARHFADHLYTIEDGRLAEVERKSKETLAHDYDRNLYLGDLNRRARLHEDDAEIELYGDETYRPLRARLIVRNNTLYVDVDADDYANVELIGEDSEVRVQEGSKESAETAEVDPRYQERFPFEAKRPSRIFSWKYNLERAFYRFRRTSRFTKVLFAGFALGAAFVAVSTFLLFNMLTLDDADFLREPRVTYHVEDGEMETYEDFRAFYEDKPIDGYNFHVERRPLELELPVVYQFPATASHRGHIAPIGLIDADDLLEGTLPQRKGDVVISDTLADEIVELSPFRAAAIDEPSELVGMSHRIALPEGTLTAQVSGIVREDARTYYADETLITQALAENYVTYELLDAHDAVSITAGRDIENPGEEILLAGEETDAFDPHLHEVNGVAYEVVGLFESETLPDGTPLLKSETGWANYYEHTHAPARGRMVYTSEPEALEAALGEEVRYENLYEVQRARAQEELTTGMGGLYVFSVVALLATALSFYFIVRSSMMGRIYEIGVYRALGMRRGEVLRLFALEVALLTTFSSTAGFLITTYALSRIAAVAEPVLDAFHITPASVGFGLLVIYAVNLLFGMLPLWKLLRRTPAEIHATYDL